MKNTSFWSTKIYQYDGLAQFYFDNITSYTNIGMLSGGIQLNVEKLSAISISDFKDKIDEILLEHVRENSISL